VCEGGVMAAAQEVYHQLIRSAARRLTGHKRRLFIAEVTDALCGGSARRSERLFGWSRDTASLGLHESAQGLRCVDNFQARGRERTEDRDTQLAQAIRALAELHTQADPQMQSALRYTRLTAVALRRALIKEKGYRNKQLPSNRTLQRMLNRMGYRLKRIQKTKPLKKIAQTDAIFANIQQRHEQARHDPETLEISIDTKAKVSLGEYSREGQTRSDAAGETPPAWDHDPKAKKRGCRSGS
jgi:Rhodopirellula transposase DDE domain